MTLSVKVALLASMRDQSSNFKGLQKDYWMTLFPVHIHMYKLLQMGFFIHVSEAKKPFVNFS